MFNDSVAEDNVELDIIERESSTGAHLDEPNAWVPLLEMAAILRARTHQLCFMRIQALEEVGLRMLIIVGDSHVEHEAVWTRSRQFEKSCVHTVARRKGEA
jgi:hypothetical protein